MESIHFGRWQLSCDPESTRKAYSAVRIGGPEECGCEPCLNFVAARDQIYETDVRTLLEKLGVSPNREVEIYHMARLESGRHLYGGWFHFVGSIIFGADAAKQVSENVWQPDLESESDNFSLGFTSLVHLIRKPFNGLPLVQLEFTAQIPWILDAKEPK